MKNSVGSRYPRSLIITCVALITIGLVPLLSRGRTISTTSTSVNVVNNSSGEIRNVYTSHVNSNDWSAGLLTAPIASGQSTTVSGFTCDQQQIKVVAEDQDGCFLSTVVTCGDNATWTITNDTTRDCGY